MKLITTAGALAVTAAIVLAGCGSISHPSAAGTHHPKLPSAPAYTPPPVAAPAGTYTGFCAYTLADSTANYPTDVGNLTGEVDLVNTGNVGTVDAVQITWPQEGYAPVVMNSTVRVPTGGTQAVPFNMIASQDIISNLQNWQNGHNYADGCTYKVTMTDTFGAVK